MNRRNWQTIYAFQTLTLPFFTELFNVWYINVKGRNVKILSENIYDLFYPIYFAFFIMGDGG
jgi:LAGLIDADG DNA endonuclease family